MSDREARLDALRDEAARRGADGATGTGYYDRPLLKPPVWTWEYPRTSSSAAWRGSRQ